MKDIEEIRRLLHDLTAEWEPRLSSLSQEAISIPRNSQDRNIRQILGHMIDSASNNIHRIVHLQYRESPMEFPNYATNGNNDQWIAIQHYEEADWENMIQLWKYLHLHFIHVISNMDSEKLGNEWISGSDYGNVSLEEMVLDFPRHFVLHLAEIKELIND